jgi:hypothetical protein
VTLSTDRKWRVVLVIDGLVFTALAIWMLVYVASEDSYRKVGVSRWETYDAKPLTVLAIAASVLTALLAGYAAARRFRWTRIVVILGVIALVLNYAAIAAMSN